ncbi:MAG TPA: autotransporter domain-containing protein [Saprospiraceae bacterium]|nr:autotransporter domain-containing protein [Saprospiraceae bacterium]HMQ85832.1 autotransporter domain-containing protein [Saprospiraceae bacterium]
MRLRFTLFTLGCLPYLAFSQVGINFSYRPHAKLDWVFANANGENATNVQTLHIGLDYWIPTGNYRFDLAPEINYGYIDHTWGTDGTGVDNYTLTDKIRFLSFFLNTNIYFLDLEGDCDCPTFSKSGGLIQKGLFLQLSPGYSLVRVSTQHSDGQSQKDDRGILSVGAGLGLDIGLTDQWTLTPFAGLRLYFDDLTQDHEYEEGTLKLVQESSNLQQVYGGLKLSFRLDQR